MELEGKVALVTGASRGMGKAIALKLASLGSKVVVNYVAIEASNKVDADNLVESIIRLGGEAMSVEADIRDSEAVKGMVEQVTDKWSKIINTNLRGAYLCTKFALRSMMRQEWGRIINISSVSGIVGNIGQSNYAASKGGLIAFTKSVAREMGSRNITVNAVAPGYIITGMTDKLPSETKEAILAMIPLQRFGQPEDVAELVAFLASDRAGYITGQAITIDGGLFP
jgi:3-oxoacyl-[acyl-carrier protein] reductase